MYVDPDPVKDAALTEALAAAETVISDHVYFDWNHTDQFDSEYSDLSLVLQKNTLEHPALTTDQPLQVNAIMGYSSAELTLVLAGTRYSDEAPVDQLLSRFNIHGPFFDQDLTNTLVKFEQRVETSAGPIDIRRFTGWVRDLQISHSTGEVTIVAANNTPWTAKLVTLPRWACDKYYDSSVVDGIGANNGNSARPINSAWVVAEVLRQAGTPLGPLEREDTIWSMSGLGSMLPSIGEKFHEPTATIDRHQLTWDTIDLLSKETPGWGPALTRVNGTPTPSNTQTRHPHQNWFRTSRNPGYVTVPRNGSSDPQRNLGFALRSLGNGSTTNVGFPSGYAWADSGQIIVFGLNSGNVSTGSTFSITVQVLANGQVFVRVLTQTGTLLGHWGWNGNRTAGWHDYDINLRFKNNAVQCVLTVDGVNQGAPNYGGDATAGFTYISNGHPTLNSRTPDDLSNSGFVIQYDPAQHYAIYWGDSTAVYRPGQRDQAATSEGKPWAIFPWCLSEMSFIPDVKDMTAWEVLEKVVTAEYGTMYVNEYAQLVYQPHYVVLNNSSLQPQAFYTVDNALDLVTNPSLDQMRNSITLAYVDRYQNLADVWTNDSPYDFTTPGDGAVHIFDTVYPVNDVVSMITHVTPVSGWQDADGAGEGTNYQQSNLSRVSAVLTSDQGADYADPNHTVGNTADNNYMNGWVIPSADQRGLQVATQGTNGIAGYFGAKVNIDTSVNSAKVPTPSWKIKGKLIGETRSGTYTLEDAASIAVNGRRSLTVEPYEWRQTLATVQAIVQALLADSETPAPMVSGLKIRTDPRLRVGDVISVQPGQYFSTPLVIQILGMITESDTATETIDARIVRSPSRWNLGITGLSELGTHTVLN